MQIDNFYWIKCTLSLDSLLLEGGRNKQINWLIIWKKLHFKGNKQVFSKFLRTKVEQRPVYFLSLSWGQTSSIRNKWKFVRLAILSKSGMLFCCCGIMYCCVNSELEGEFFNKKKVKLRVVSKFLTGLSWLNSKI